MIEFLDLVERLTQPERFGGDSVDAFHVVCPSLPGVAFSAAPADSGFGARAIAQRHATLMSALGYSSYLAQGGDWGAIITRQLAAVDSTHCQGIHLNMIPAEPPAHDDLLQGVSAQEQQALAQSQQFMANNMGYYHIQSTQPLTLAYALADSPLGLAAWLAEKFYAWSDQRPGFATALTLDAIVANICLYWFCGSINASMRIYFEEMRAPSPQDRVDVATGVAVFPAEILQTPRAWAERLYHIIHWSLMDRGGHFAAMEQPELLACDLRLFRQRLVDTASLQVENYE